MRGCLACPLGRRDRNTRHKLPITTTVPLIDTIVNARAVMVWFLKCGYTFCLVFAWCSTRFPEKRPSKKYSHFLDMSGTVDALPARIGPMGHAHLVGHFALRDAESCPYRPQFCCIGDWSRSCWHRALTFLAVLCSVSSSFSLSCWCSLHLLSIIIAPWTKYVKGEKHVS